MSVLSSNLSLELSKGCDTTVVPLLPHEVEQQWATTINAQCKNALIATGLHAIGYATEAPCFDLRTMTILNNDLFHNRVTIATAIATGI